MNKIKFRRGSLNNKKNIDIEDGEPIYLTDTKRLYVSNEDVAINNVYVGSQEPNDPGINVWIDPQGVNNVIDMIYPIGSIYMSVNDTNPSILFSGEWERIQGKFLLGANDDIEEYNAGKMGGEVAHKLTVDEMPSHNHNPSDQGPNWVPSTAFFSRRNIALGSSGVYIPTPDSAGINGWKWGGTSLTGGGQEHNNMPPFLSVYIWKRVG